MKSDAEVLTDALALVEGDGAWCKGSFCSDAKGNFLSWREDKGWCNVDIYSDRHGFIQTQPAAWCLEGAIRQAAGYFSTGYFSTNWLECTQDLDIEQQVDRLDRLVRDQAGARWASLHNLSLHNFNDDQATTQEDAILALKKAIAQVE